MRKDAWRHRYALVRPSSERRTSPHQTRYLVSPPAERDAFFLSSWKLNRFKWRPVSDEAWLVRLLKFGPGAVSCRSACEAQQQRSFGGVVAGEHSEVEMVHRRARLIRSSTTRGGSHIELEAAGFGSGVLTEGLTGCIVTSSPVIWKLKTRGSVWAVKFSSPSIHHDEQWS